MTNRLVNHTTEVKRDCFSEILNEPRHAIAFLYGFAIIGKIDALCQKEIDSTAGLQERTKAG